MQLKFLLANHISANIQIFLHCTSERCSVPAYGVYGSTRRPMSYPVLLWVWGQVLSLWKARRSHLLVFRTFFSRDIIEEDCKHFCCLGSLSWFLLASDAGKWRCMTSHKICWHLVAMTTRSTRRPVDAVSRQAEHRSGCITYHSIRCSYDFIVPCISGNRLVCFISGKYPFLPCPWQPKIWNYTGGSKNNVC